MSIDQSYATMVVNFIILYMMKFSCFIASLNVIGHSYATPLWCNDPSTIVYCPCSIPLSFYHCRMKNWYCPLSSTSFFFEFRKWTDQLFTICSPSQLPDDAMMQKNFIRLTYDLYIRWCNNAEKFHQTVTDLWPLLKQWL